MVVKGCDSKGVIELLAEKLIDKDDVTIFGMGCNGTVDLNRVLEKLPEGASVEDVKCSGNTIRVTAGGQEYTVSMQDAAQDKCRQSQIFAEYPDASFYIMSVNPVGDACSGASNEEIRDFNAKLKESFPDQYLDCYDYLEQNGFSTVDD